MMIVAPRSDVVAVLRRPRLVVSLEADPRAVPRKRWWRLTRIALLLFLIVGSLAADAEPLAARIHATQH